MKKKREIGLVENLGDMTSMIDVVFLLLIFFILMPFKTTESRIESHLPKDSGPDAKKNPIEQIDKIDIKIVVDKTKEMNLRTFEGVKLSVNGKKISNFNGLKSRLEDMRTNIKIDPSKVPVELNADEDVPFYFILKALDYAKLSNFSLIKYPVPANEKNKKRH